MQRKPKSGQQSPTVRTPNTSKHNTWTLQESLDRVQDDKLLVKEGALKGPVFVQVEVLKPKDVFVSIPNPYLLIRNWP